jgi:LPS-assembly protein
VLFLSLFQTNFSFAIDIDLNIEERLEGDPEARWQITAYKMSYMEKEGIVTAEGDVVITRGDQTLSAQKATYYEKTGIVEASGDIRLESEGDFLTAESAVFDLNKGTGKITGGQLFLRENNYYIRGDSMEKVGPNSYKVKAFKATTCDGDKPAWSFTGSELDVTIEGYGKVKHVAFRIKDVPVFYVPYALFPAKTKRQSGLLMPAAGYSKLNGYGFELPIYWAISEQTDATYYARYLSKRGLMNGFEFRYLASMDSKGEFLFDVLSDKIEEKNLNDPDQAAISPFPRTNHTRYWLRTKTDQQLPGRVEARLDTDYVSDKDYLREFPGLIGYDARSDLEGDFGRPLEEIWSPTRRSALRLSRDGKGYSLQALSSYNQNPLDPPLDTTPQPLAAVNYSLLPWRTPVLPMFFNVKTNYDYIWREEGIKGHNLSLTPELTYPLLSRYLAFEPSITYSWNSQWLDENPLGINQQSGNVYRIGARTSTVLERIFQYEGKSIKKLKHKFTPALRYEYRVPEEDKEFSPWFDPIDEEGRVNKLSLDLENLLDARREDEAGNASYNQWGSLRFSQGYDIDESRRDEDPSQEKKPFDPFIGVLNLRPFGDFDLQAAAQWDWDKSEIPSGNISFFYNQARSGGRTDRYSLVWDTTKGGDKYLNFDIDFNLAYGYSIGGGMRRNLIEKQNVSGRIWLDYQSQCWGARASFEEINGIERIFLTIRLLNLGEIGARASVEHEGSK